MLKKMRSTKGFTLIELLIVVAIIGILAAVAIPQFSMYQKRGYASAVRSDIRNVHSAVKAWFSDDVVNRTAADAETKTGPGAMTKYPSAKISTGVTAVVNNGSEDGVTITGTHGKLGASATYVMTGVGGITDSLSAGF